MKYFTSIGMNNVRRSVFLKDKNNNRSEIDVVFGSLWWRRYVECKNYGKDHPVPLEVTQCCSLSVARVLAGSPLPPHALDFMLACVISIEKFLC